jgi:hypothetical protein
MDGESGPTLDLGLLLYELGIVDSRRIHDPLDETDSLRVPSSANSRGEETSSCLITDGLRVPV